MLLLGTCNASCESNYTGQVEPIIIGTTVSEVNSLILVAEENGYFTNYGLTFTQKIYASGAAALDGLLKGEIDLATGSEFAFVSNILSGRNLTTLGSICTSSIEYLVARKDRGINNLAGLKGKRIGVPKGSRPEFALDRFLTFNGVDLAPADLINIPVDKSVDAIVNGDVDAVAAWQPFIDQIRAKMGDNVVTWDVQKDQPSYTLLMCRGEWAPGNRELASRIVKALVKAEVYAGANSDKAKTMIQNKLGYDRAYMDSVWPDYSFEVTLNQALIVAMEDQSRWMIKNNLAAGKDVPLFNAYLYEDALKAIKPEAVNIIA